MVDGLTLATQSELRAATPRLRGRSSDPAEVSPRERETQDAACRFAGLLAGSFVKEMVQAAGGLVAEGPGQDVLQGLLVQTLADEITRTGTLGIADHVLHQLRSPPADARSLTAQASFALSKTVSLPLGGSP